MKFKNNGFSLLELMISGSIIGFSSLLMMKMMESNMSQEALMKYETAVKQTVYDVQTFLSNPQKCTEMLRGKTIGASITSLTITVPGGTKDILRRMAYPQFTVSNITARASGITSASFDLEIQFTAPNRGFLSSFFTSSKTNMTELIPVIGTRNYLNTIQTCGPAVSDVNAVAKKKFCDSLGSSAATWIAWNNTCALNSSQYVCPGEQVPIGIRRLGQFNCQLITNLMFNYASMFNLSSKNCPTKIYSIYLDGNGKFNIGCPTATDLATDATAPNLNF